MRAVAYRLACDLRTRWTTIALLTTVVAILCGVVIAFTTGAHRTSTVPERYERSSGLDIDFEVTQEEGGPPRTDEVGPLPGVTEAASYTFVFGIVRSGATHEPIDAIVFGGSELAVGARIISGRATDPTVEGEFVATPSFLELSGAELGDQFVVSLFTQQQGDAGEFPFGQPAGRSVTATLVGVAEGPQSIEDPSAMTVFSRALLEQPDIGVSQSKIVVSVEDGVDLAQFQAELDSLPDGGSLSAARAEIITAEMRRAISTQARAMWILALVAAIAVIAVLGQVITRQMRQSIPEHQQLAAIGFTKAQILAETTVRAALPIVLGCLVGGAASTLFTARFPIGFVRQIEPSPGILVQWRPLLIVVVALIAVLVSWMAISSRLSNTAMSKVRSPGPLPWAIDRHISPAAGVGLRFAFTRARGERGSVRANLAGVVFTVCGLVAAITFGTSVARLIDQPFRYGSNFDLAMGDNGGEQIDPQLADVLRNDPDVTSLMFYAQSYARSGSTTVQLGGLQAVRGEGTPVMASGRAPVAGDEIALGRLDADALGVGIGDRVQLAGPTRTDTFRVTGIAVIAGLGSNEGIGEGGVVTLQSLQRLDEDVQITSALVQIRPDSEVFDTLRAMFPDASADEGFEPSAIVNINRVRTIPFVLAAVLAVLCVLTVAHAMFTSLRARRRDMAVLRSLGADRGFLSRAVHWQSTVFTVVPALVAAPVGFIGGRAIFAVYANDIGALDDAAVPVPMVVSIIAGVAVLANAVATQAAHRERRVTTASVLQHE